MSHLPTSVIYGTLPADAGFAVLETTEALQRAEELEAIMGCRTVGAVRSLLPRLKWTSPPPVDLDDDVADDAPFDWAEAVNDSEGSWPTMTQQLVLEWVTEDFIAALVKKAGARVEFTAFNGDILEIPKDREDGLLSVLNQFEMTYERNDKVMGVIGIESLYS